MRYAMRRVARRVPWLMVAVLVAVSGYQFASAKNSAGYIHACVDRQTRLVHIVGANSACSAGQISKGWNMRGPRGRRGRFPKNRTWDVCVGAGGALSLKGTT